MAEVSVKTAKGGVERELTEGKLLDYHGGCTVKAHLVTAAKNASVIIRWVPIWF